MAKKPHSLESLDQEIVRLRGRAKKLEGDLDEQFTYLQENYSSLFMKSVFPGLHHRNGIPSNLVELVLGNDRLREAVGRLTDKVFDRLSDGLEFIADKLEKKKAE